MNGWVKLPRRVTATVEVGQINSDDLGLLAYLLAKLDWRTGRYVTTLADLKAATRFPGKRTEYLRRRLHLLRGLGLLSVEVPPGGTVWVFSAPAADEPPTDLQPTSNSGVSPRLEVTSPELEVEAPSDASNGAAPSAFRPPSSWRPIEVEIDKEPTPGGGTSPRRQAAPARSSSLRIEDDCAGCGDRTAVEERRPDVWLCDSCAAKGPAA